MMNVAFLLSSMLLLQTLDATEQLLRDLTDAHGVPGFEGEVRDILRREWQPVLSNLRTDGIGNLLGERRGSADSPRVLLMVEGLTADEVRKITTY
ncbi:MAG TPA: hypothetical protein VEK15_29900 [Vicinamibacteria bacterium]|nr:hypothetical protein [Vicinamibacteria bacterium]